MTIEVFAPAKINLTLHVTGQRAGGYHLLDSLVVFADVGDRIWIEPSDQMSLEVTGPFADGVPADGRNLVWQAAELAGYTGHIRLQKNLPHGAGLGGGSADAAAILRNRFGDDVISGVGLERALALGADVPVCMCTQPQRMQGIGEKLSRVGSVPSCAIVLVNPGVCVPTPDVFRLLEQKDNPAMGTVTAGGGFEEFLSFLGHQRNDLERPAGTLAPVIWDVLDALSPSARLFQMSGSGATCYGLYASDAEANMAADHITAAYPDWWVCATRTYGSGPLS